MLLSGNRPVNTALNSAFPLFHVTAYDFFYKNSPWLVGLQSTNSTAVKKKIAAVIISEFTGLKSLDNILRTYLKDTTYPNGDKDRLDLRVDAFITKRISNFDTQIFALSFQQFNSSNPAFSLFPFGRAKFTTELLMCCAHKGALFEFVAIARMMLEQIAWAFELSKSLDDDAVRNVSATRSISQLRDRKSVV